MRAAPTPRRRGTPRQGHGVCQMEAPEIFRVRQRAENHDRVEVLLDRIPEELRAKLESAVRYIEEDAQEPRP